MNSPPFGGDTVVVPAEVLATLVALVGLFLLEEKRLRVLGSDYYKGLSLGVVILSSPGGDVEVGEANPDERPE